MTKIMPQLIPGAVPSAIASYDATDIAEGTGIQTFYCIRSEVSGSATWKLISDPVKGGGSDAQQKIVTSDVYTFDLTAFNLPKDMKGTGYLSGTLQETAGTGILPWLQVKLQKVSGGNATDICDPVETQTPAAISIEHFFIPLNIATLAHFKRGDILRLHIAVRATADNYLHVNPVDTTNQPLKLFVPFRIQE